MPRQTLPQNSLNGGEITPRAFARNDFVKYQNSVKIAENVLVNQLGGAQMCPGTKYVAATKDSAARARLIPFQFNSAQAYLLELGNLYMRFFVNKGQLIVSASNPIDDDTKLLIHFDGSNGVQSYTAETGQAISFFDDAQLSTSQKKFGASSLVFDGSGDKVSLSDSDDWDFGTGDFAIDMWVRFNSRSASNVFLDRGNALGYSWEFATGTNKMQWNSGNVQRKSETWNPSTGVWYHIAVTRDGTNLRFFVDGTELGSATTNSSDLTYGYDLYLGANTGSTQPFDGWMDEVRISKANSRWTANFTPPINQYGGAEDWATSTAYVIGNYVTESATVYLCLEAHTSGTFSTDLAAGKWTAQFVYEISSVYALAEIKNIQYSQDADVMYMYHPSYPVQKLTRISATEFTLVQVDFVRGPFIDSNITATTLNPSAATGTGITVTASTDTFLDGHIGSFWRIKDGVVKITAVASPTSVTADVQAEPDGTAGNLGGTSAVTDWAEGAFSAVRGYPSSGQFHEQRHVLAATDFQPQHEWYSVIGAYENMKVDANDDAAAFIIRAAQTNNRIRWLDSDSQGLQAGSGGGTIHMSTGSDGVAFTATNVIPKRGSSYGAASIAPQRISSFLYYVHKTLFKLFELSFDLLKGRDVASDMTKLADHILRDGSGAYEIAYQQSPNDRIWVVRTDGQLAIMTRNPTEDVTGWSRRIAGADSISNGKFESIAVIKQDDEDDQVWVIVKRNVNGSVVRYVEYFTGEYYENEWEPILLDSALTLDNPIDISSVTAANPVVVSASDHGFSNGDMIKHDELEGMTELNGNTYKIANKTDDTYELNDTSDNNIDGSGFSAHIVSTGQARKKVTAISGLDHLEAETVSVQIDGELPTTETYVVSSGAITLSTAGAVVHVGLPYTPKIVLLKLSGQTQKGTGQTKKQRIYGINIRVDRTKQFQIGQTESAVVNTKMPATGLYSGDVKVPINGYWEEGTEIVIKQTKPLPLFILGLFIKVDIQEN